jgi:uncharacterized phage-like protein YoqJ
VIQTSFALATGMRGEVVAATGHRPGTLGGYSEQAQDRRYKVAYDWLKRNQPGVVISGMALGWDQAVAQACTDIKIPWYAYVPFEGQERMWPAQSQLYYRNLLTMAAKTVHCCPPGYEAWKMQKRNERMVDDATVLLALWSGSPGGTSNCIKYAQTKQRQIINLYQEWLRYT